MQWYAIGSIDYNESKLKAASRHKNEWLSIGKLKNWNKLKRNDDRNEKQLCATI